MTRTELLQLCDRLERAKQEYESHKYSGNFATTYMGLLLETSGALIAGIRELESELAGPEFSEQSRQPAPASPTCPKCGETEAQLAFVHEHAIKSRKAADDRLKSCGQDGLTIQLQSEAALLEMVSRGSAGKELAERLIAAEARVKELEQERECGDLALLFVRCNMTGDFEPLWKALMRSEKAERLSRDYVCPTCGGGAIKDMFSAKDADIERLTNRVKELESDRICDREDLQTGRILLDDWASKLAAKDSEIERLKLEVAALKGDER